MTKRWLDNNGLDYVTYDASDPKTSETLQAAGWRTLPVVVAPTGSFSGYDPVRLTELIGK